MLERHKTPNKKLTIHTQEQRPAENHTRRVIPRPVNCEYRESFSTAVSPSLAERGYEEYLATRASGPLPTAESISPTFTFGSHNLPTPSSSQGSICPAQGPPIEIFQTQQENMQRKSSYCSKINKRPDTPPDSPRVSAKINIDGWHRGGIGDRPLSRQYTTSSQVSRGSSTRKAEWAPLDMPSGESKERLALQRVDSCPPGGFVRSYNVPNAIVAPIVRLARVVSIPNINEGSTITITTPPVINTNVMVPYPIRSPSVTESSISSLHSGHKVKSSRSIRSFWKVNVQDEIRPQVNVSFFDDNTSEEGERPGDRPRKSIFNLRRPKGRETYSEPSVQDPEVPRPKTSQPLCTRWCTRPRCFHDCDVLHIKTESGHDCLVLELVAGRTTVTAGTLDGLLLELCAPLNDRSDPTFTDRFIRVCGSFCSPFKALKRLRQQYHKNSEPANQRRVVEVIIRWLRIQPEDFLLGDTLSSELSSFVEEINEPGYQIRCQELQSACEKFSRKLKSYQKFSRTREIYSLDTLIEGVLQTMRLQSSQSLPPPDTSVLDIGTNDLAKYFAALDLILFRDASENRTIRNWFQHLLNSALTEITSEEAVLVERVQRVLRRSEMIRDWVVYEVLQAETNILAAVYIEKFIDLAKILHELGNFQTTISVLDAITSDAIIGAFGLWEEVRTEKLNLLERLRYLQTEDGYLEALQAANVPVVPYLHKFLNQVHKAQTDTYYHLDTGGKKRHMDLSLDKCGYTHFPDGYHMSKYRQRLHYTTILDITKYGAFYHQISLARQKAWRAHNFERLSRQAWVFGLYLPGRSAFCKTTLAERPSRDSSFTQATMASEESLINTDQCTSSTLDIGGAQLIPSEVSSGRLSRKGKLPPSPPITPPTSTYFESKRISSINGPGGLDWMSETVERRIVEAHVFSNHDL